MKEKKVLWGKRSRYAHIFAVLMVVVFLCNSAYGAERYPWAVSYTTYDVTYEAILKMYLKVINGYKSKNYGRHDLFNENLYFDAPENLDLNAFISGVKNKYGYCIEDINQDGIDELLICSTDGYIYEVFTKEKLKVRELIRGGGRYYCKLIGDGNFYRHGSSGAGYSSVEIWTMNGTDKVTLVTGYYSKMDESDSSGRAPDLWYQYENSKVERTYSSKSQVSHSVVRNWIKECEENIKGIRVIPLSVYEKYSDDPGNIAVLSLAGKTSGNAKIRIRKEPLKNARVLDNKKVGTFVKILGKDGEYYRVRIGAKEGYVQEEYVTLLTVWDELSE